MIRKPAEFGKDVRKNMRGGDGEVIVSAIWKPGEEMKSNTRMYSKLILEPGCSIGLHPHENEEELFFILKGRAETIDNGEPKILEAGDASITRSGESHSLKNIGSDTLEVLAIIARY